jgi:hypothetical protein
MDVPPSMRPPSLGKNPFEKARRRPGSRYPDAQGDQLKKVVTPEAKRNTVRYLQESFGQSLRKLFVLLGLSRASWHYKPKVDVNESIRKRLRELADERKRWGYRRLYYLLRREGYLINHKRTERLQIPA